MERRVLPRLFLIDVHRWQLNPWLWRFLQLWNVRQRMPRKFVDVRLHEAIVSKSELSVSVTRRRRWKTNRRNSSSEWRVRGAEFLTDPKDHGREIRCYVRDPDGHLIEVGQSTGMLNKR